MDVAIHWQDADSSSAKAVREIYPKAEIMLCGGHAGRAHRNILENVRKIKCYHQPDSTIYVVITVSQVVTSSRVFSTEYLVNCKSLFVNMGGMSHHAICLLWLTKVCQKKLHPGSVHMLVGEMLGDRVETAVVGLFHMTKACSCVHTHTHTHTERKSYPLTCSLTCTLSMTFPLPT